DRVPHPGRRRSTRRADGRIPPAGRNAMGQSPAAWKEIGWWSAGVPEDWERPAATPAVPPSLSFSRRQAGEAGFEFAFAAHADNLLGDLSLRKQEQCRHSTDAVLGGQLLLLVNVDLGDFDAAIILVGQFVENRRDHFAGTAPFSPKINQHGCRRFQDFDWE